MPVANAPEKTLKYKLNPKYCLNSKASPHLSYGKHPYNLPWPALIEGIYQPFNTVQVVETDKDDEVADAETADEDDSVLKTVEAADAEEDAEDDEDV